MTNAKKKSSEDDNTLWPIKEENKRKRKFAVIDVEAQNWIEYVVAGIFDGKNFYHTKHCYSLILECFKISKNKGIDEFFAHFGGKYDFLFFLKEAILNEQFSIVTIVPRGSGILHFDIEMKMDYCLNNDLDYYQGKITFRDSSALLPFSLESACKSFGVKNSKTYFDYNFVAHSYRNEDYFKEIMTKEAYEIYYEGEIISTWKEVLTKNGESKVWKQVICKYPKSYDKTKVSYKILTDKKADFLHKIYNRQDILDYLEMDLKALYECLTKFYEWELVSKVGGSTTVAGQALKVLRWFLESPLYSIVQPSDNQSHLDEFVRNAYFGGRTEIFKPLYLAEEEDEKIYCYDVNSLYPTVMSRNRFPNKFKKWSINWTDFNQEEFGYWKCDVEVPEDCYFPVLGVSYTDENKNTRFIFPTGKFSGTWSACELKYAISQGTKITKLRRGAIFHDGGDFFKPFIDYLYEKRLKAKAEKDPVGDIMCKLLMNSCYGKTGIDVFGKENLVLCENGEFDVEFEIPLGDDLFASLRPVNVKLEKTFNNVAIAAWVTALARIHLHKEVFMKAGKGNVYYGDSVTKDRKMLVQDSFGNIKIMSVEEIYNSQPVKSQDAKMDRAYGMDYKTISWNGTKLEMKRIDYVYRHKAEKKIIQVSSNMGRTQITEDHSLIDKDNNKLNAYEAESLFSPKNSFMNDLKFKEIEEIDLLPYFIEGDYPNFSSRAAKKLRYDDNRIWFEGDYAKILPPSIRRKWSGEALKDLMLCLAFYISEGSSSTPHTTKTRFMFQINSEQVEVLRKIQKTLIENTDNIAFGMLKSSKKDNTTKLHSGTMLMAYFFKVLCGQKSTGKKMPDFIFNLSKENRDAFIEGLKLGDAGYCNQEKYSEKYRAWYFNYSTQSYDLSCSLSLLLNYHGFIHSIKFRKSKNLYTLSISKTQRIKKPIIEEIIYDDYVYDLSVSENHNFFDAMGLIGLHNTDSCYTTQKLETGKALGDLKEEYSAKEAVFILPKTYYIGDGEQDGETFDKKVTMKGFDKKKTQSFNLEDFTSALEGDLRLLRMDEQPKVATFKTALRYGELLMMKNDPKTLKSIHERKEQEYLTKHGKRKKYVREEYKMSERAIKSSYNKRIIIKEGWDTKPINLE
jgi:hypothetical protein